MRKSEGECIEGVSLPSHLEGLGSIVKLHQWVRGRAPTGHVLAHIELQGVHLVTRNVLCLMIKIEMVGIHLESGRILPKAGRLAYVFQQQRMAEVHAWTEVQCFPLQWLIIIWDCFRSIHQVAPQGGFKIHSSCLTDNTGGITVKAACTA